MEPTSASPASRSTSANLSSDEMSSLLEAVMKSSRAESLRSTVQLAKSAVGSSLADETILERLWRPFVSHQLLTRETHRLIKALVPSILETYPIIDPNNKDHVDFKLQQRTEKILIECDRLGNQAMERVKSVASSSHLEQGQTIVEFEQYVKQHLDSESCLQTNFRSFDSVATLFRRDLELRPQPMKSSQIDSKVERLLQLLKTSNLVVRVWIASLPMQDPAKLNPIQRVGEAVAQLYAKTFFRYGTNHVGIQVGPYFIHWTDSDTVSIYPMNSHFICAMFYPKADSTISLADQRFRSLCNLIARWNAEKSYNRITCNCQHFVDEALEVLDMKPAWQTRGPLHLFIQSIARLEYQHSSMVLRGLDGVETHINSHHELVNYCNSISEAASLNAGSTGRRLKEAYLASLSNPASDKDQHEFLQVLKGVERAILISTRDRPESPKTLIFPKLHRDLDTDSDLETMLTVTSVGQ